MTSMIRRLLVANRGEIALRVMRTARSLGIQTVAVYSDPDASAPHVARADRAVRLPGSSSAQTYLDGSRVIEAALASGADAIHPGYGFLSENPDFARAVEAAGLIWIGPTPESIEAMALKVEAKRIAAGAGVPLVPGAELGNELSAQEVLAACDAVGYPLIVKASAGGGGKGMRVVEARADLVESLATARREAASSFGDDTVFVERFLAGARHVEVQVFGDQLGNVIHLHERECSIQRRHQKVVEEAPSPGVTDAVRTQLHAAAVSLARAIGYVGAGTVEFMVFGAGDAQEFFFLEMNTRLQVEHPVTEAITGADLVAWQIAVATGAPLPLAQDQVERRGHAIEVRLYAEDPAEGYLPATGTVHRFAWEAIPGLRVDAGIASGSLITPHYDPMLAKVIGHAPSRSGAAALLADGLSRMTIHGPVNNRESLIAILRSTAFLAGDTTTSFLDRNPQVARPIGCAEDDARHVIAAAAAIAALDTPDRTVPLGWRNVPGVPEFVTLRRRGGGVITVLHDTVRGSVRIARSEEVPYATVFALDADALDDVSVRVVDLDPEGAAVVRVAVDGVSATCRVHRYGASAFVDDGIFSSAWTIEPRFVDHTLDAVGHGPATKVPGTITAVHVVAGDAVAEGQALVVLEAMKMEHTIRADAAGVIETVLVEVGQSVDAHTVVVEFREGGDLDG